MLIRLQRIGKLHPTVVAKAAHDDHRQGWEVVRHSPAAQRPGNQGVDDGSVEVQRLRRVGIVQGESGGTAINRGVHLSTE